MQQNQKHQTQKTHLVSDQVNENSVSGVPTALKTNIKHQWDDKAV